MHRTSQRPTFAERVRRSLDGLGVRGTDAHVLVAVSGGCDSVALLHLLRFAADDAGLRVSAAHFDHAMRPGSEGDAAWVCGLCRAWGVPLMDARADIPPRTEAEARDARYAFLRRAQEACGAAFLATAHHADDQAETVLFRVLRGTGLGGLAGIPPRDT
ncbi:tRNA lysidine(34) synthetase TilS, partial [Longimicrobium sp.]|uniref:tRNA lysidine(34) synthetase TilS n=1 Tax=Longimicrobium sp. TaxID=2029185 RepID=UPI002E34FD8D